ncbi:hypothetical protein SSS_09790 [Sarcoptes scabiei]|uniref:Uncharacterized protein n=1 Tax=Sarcoptes scabiei TaxID=52283 RepID=A0A834RDB7_SARSC|nr:hypothetical protein SSS_09790 [Sarcoptes scabiei]
MMPDYQQYGGSSRHSDGSNSDGAKSEKEIFRDALNRLNVWIWQCQTWIYFHGSLQNHLQHRTNWDESIRIPPTNQPDPEGAKDLKNNNNLKNSQQEIPASL